MRFNILCDADWEAKIDEVLRYLSNLGYRRFFEETDYGASLDGITIVLMCQDPDLHLKQRIRNSTKEKKLYIDIMLDLPRFKKMEQSERNDKVKEKIVSEIPPIVAKYKFSDFDLDRFEQDIRLVFK